MVLLMLFDSFHLHGKMEYWKNEIMIIIVERIDFSYQDFLQTHYSTIPIEERSGAKLFLV